MRRILVLFALAACGRSTTVSTEPPEPQLALHPPDAVVLDSLIGTNVVAVLRTKPDHFPVLAYLQSVLGPNKAPCWAALEAKLVNTYQLQIPKPDGNGKTSYYILEGDLPRADVVRCVPAAITMFPVKVADVGELLAVSGPDGATTYAAWKGPFVIVGRRDIVETARTASPTAPPSRWHDRLAAPLAAPLWWASTDDLFANLFGVQTLQYEVSIERMEKVPNPYFAGRAFITYTSPGDAAIVARRIKQGEVKLPIDSPEIVDSIKRFKVKQTGPVVEIGFDLGMFGGITADTLVDLTARMMAQQQR